MTLLSPLPCLVGKISDIFLAPWKLNKVAAHCLILICCLNEISRKHKLAYYHYRFFYTLVENSACIYSSPLDDRHCFIRVLPRAPQ